MVRRGDIYLIDFGKVEGVSSIQKGIRPGIVVSNDANNQYSTTLCVIPLTSNMKHTHLPTHVTLGVENGLLKPSMAMTEQIITIDKSALLKKVGQCTNDTIHKLNAGMRIQLGLTS